MRKALYIISCLLLGDLLFNNCANPGTPTGGPKDTIPPTITYSSPVNGTTNFQGSSFEFEFSEYINADKLKQQLIITPQTNIQYKTVIKRNKLILKLDGELKDTTTYNFNFANGVTDITEKNPVINFSLALSTGQYIDSMSVKGTVEDLFTKEPGKGFVVGLYPFSDSLDYLKDKPMYFTTANDSGKYEINYIKVGKYKIISFDDDNGNYILDPETESHGFLEDTINLDSVTSLSTIRCLLQNIRPLVLINTRSVGRYVEVKFNKQIDSYDLSNDIPSNIIGENKDVLRLYKTETTSYNDSLTTIITAQDSLGNQVIDTITYVFLESNRKPSNFSYSISKKNIEIKDNPSVRLFFNKPISKLDTSHVILKVDSTFESIVNFNTEWNKNRTEVDIKLNVKQNFIDSLLTSISQQDTTNLDSTKTSTTKKRQLNLVFKKSSFISIESDSSTNQTIKFKEAKPTPSGVLKVTINTSNPNYTFQLLNKKAEVAYERMNQSSFTINSISPDTYTIRILIDTNNDGEWSYGNLLSNEEPEEVFLYDEATSIRENWVVELSIDM